MAADAVAGRGPIPGPVHRGLARWSVGLAVAVIVVLAVSYAIFGIAYAIDGSEAVEDTWIGYLGGASLVGGLAASLLAFALALTAKAKHERSRALWLPLSLFPALVTVVVLVETLWME